MRKISLTNKILIAMVLGALVGILFNQYGMENYFINDIMVNTVFYIIGNVFLNAIKMLVVPLVFVSITLGIAQMGDTAKLGRIGARTISFYMITTIFAIIIGLLIANIINPGIGLDLTTLNTQNDVEVITNETSFADSIIQMVPTNVIQAFYDSNMIQIILFAVFFGIAITSLGKKVDKLHVVFQELNDIFLKMLTLLMKFAPLAVFSLIITTFSDLGIEVMIPLISYIFTVLLALLLHVVIIYFFILLVILKLNPIKFLSNMKSSLSLAFTTSSSAGSLPVTKKCVEDNCGVDNTISSFVLPIGSTINMDGTAIMQGVAVVFIAQAFQVELSAMDYLIVILTATLASVGTAAVPGAGIVMLSMVIAQVGLPLEAIGVLLGVDRLVDMSRTVVNVCGDSICSIYIAQKEKLFNKEIFIKDNKQE